MEAWGAPVGGSGGGAEMAERSGSSVVFRAGAAAVAQAAASGRRAVVTWMATMRLRAVLRAVHRAPMMRGAAVENSRWRSDSGRGGCGGWRVTVKVRAAKSDGRRRGALVESRM